MRALVTGGAGFVGSNVVDKLRAHGVRVRIFDTIAPEFGTDAEFYQGTLLDLEALGAAMVRVNVVFHLAAVADVKDVFENPHYSENINVRGTINVLEAARRSGVERIVYGSTTWVYGDVTEKYVDEQTRLSPPAHLYTATKIVSEYYCQCYGGLYDLPYTILRYGIPYGPRARDGAVIPIFVHKAMNGEPLTIAGDGSQFRQFVYVEDLAEGNVLALKSIAANKIYNLDGAEKISIRQIAETTQKLVGGVEIKNVPGRPGDFSGKEISSELAKKELGWSPKVRFEEGLRNYIDWFTERKEQNEALWSQLDESLIEGLQ